MKAGPVARKGPSSGEATDSGRLRAQGCARVLGVFPLIAIAAGYIISGEIGRIN